MSNRLLTPVIGRLNAIVANGRGTSAPWSTEARGRAIPARIFRPTQNNVRLEDCGMSGQQWDRSYCWRWESIGDFPSPANAYSSPQTRVLSITLDVGYLQGFVAEVGPLVNTMSGTGETAAIALADARERALEDGEMVWTALNYAPLYQNGAPTSDDITPAIVAVTRSSCQIRETGSTRLIAGSRFDVVISYTAGQVFP